MASCLVLLFLSAFTLGEGRSFASSHLMFERHFEADVRTVQQELQEALHSALGQGHGVDQKQISVANATLLPIFASLPKNEHGRVGAPGMRYAVQRYFSKNHGWVIKGFESHSNAQQGQAADVRILGNKVPGFVEAALEEMLQKGGFALADILTVVIVVERLIFDEVASSVESAYHLNDLRTEHILSRDSLETVLESHLIVEMMERHDGFDKELHKEDKEQILNSYDDWQGLQDFMKDIIATESSPVLGSGTHNPFSSVGTEFFSFDDAVRIAQRISNEYGRWGNQECMELKSFLSDMDKTETGRLPLSGFYQVPDGRWSFHESPEYLRELGALDDSSKALGPQVIISNYVYGMSNCLSSTPYYSVCCLNECEGLLQQIEMQVAKPSATPAEILDGMSRIRMMSFTADVSSISSKFQTKLEDIAAKGDGKVPLHGRLFAQWLHYNFPHQCPFPHAAGSLRPQTQGERLSANTSISVEDGERSEHIQPKVQKVSLSKMREASSETTEDLWSWDEELMHAPQHHHDSSRPQGTAGPRLWPAIIAAGILFAVKQLHTSVTTATKQRMLIPMTMKSMKSHDL